MLGLDMTAAAAAFAVALLCGTTVIAQVQPGADAVDYGRVRELLHVYYQRSAKLYGHDYDPDAVMSDTRNTPCDDNTEACANKHVWGDLFEHDIALTLQQAESLLNETGQRGKRQAEKRESSIWPAEPIRYKFVHQDSGWQDLIRSALRHIEAETCVRFSYAPYGKGDMLSYARGSGCWSNVGKIGGAQTISIGYGCDSMGIVAHETLHALGLWHEQSRTDRDNHIFINPGAIISGTEGNFQKRTLDNSDNMGQPYDVGSVMHYGSKAFSRDWTSYTIETRDSRYQRTIGQRERISFKDGKMINLRYCKESCSRELECQNDGYTDPNRCYQCKCPSGYGGKYCEKVERSSCGGELLATTALQTLESGKVSPNSYCVWRIRSPAGEKLEVAFESISFVCRDVCQSSVEVKYHKDKTISGARLCCDEQRTTLVTEDDQVVLIFKGEPDMVDGYLGFSIRYRYFGSPTLPPAPTTTPTTTTTEHRTTTTETTTETPSSRTTRHPQSTLVTKQKTPSPPSPLPTTTTTEETTTSELLTTEEPEKTTTTEEATTEDPFYTTDTPPVPEPHVWSAWSEWSRCTESCGGCGRRRRMRACFASDGSEGECNGYPTQVQPCNSHTCNGGKSGHVCSGRIVLPCDLAGKLHFGTKPQKDENATPAPLAPFLPLPPLFTPGLQHNSLLPLPRREGYQKPKQEPYVVYKPRAKRHVSTGVSDTGFANPLIPRQGDEKLCEKRFTYYCPSRLLSIHIDWLRAADAVPQHSDSPQCCAGYYASGDRCYKNT